MSHIHVITPVVSRKLEESLLTAYPAEACQSTKVSFSCLDYGPDSVESMYEDAISVPGTVQKALEAEQAGADAIIINCMNDPGLEAARSVVSIPVIGAAHANMMVAGLLAHNFSIIGTSYRDVRPNEILVHRYGLQEKYVSSRWVSIPVLDLYAHKEELINNIVEQVTAAVEHDGAQAVIFGCTVMRIVIKEVRQQLLARGIDIPIPDPALVPLKWAETLVALGLTHSKKAYPLVERDQLLQEVSKPEQPMRVYPGQQKSRHRLTVIVPAVQGERNPDWLDLTRAGYSGAARQGNTVEVVAIQEGPSELMTPYHKAMAVPGILRLALQAQRNGASAVLIDCMDDPGLDATREALDIPAIGPMQASAYLAATIGRRVSILGTEPSNKDVLIESFNDTGLGSMLASVRCIGLSPAGIDNNRERAREVMIETARLAIQEDGAQVIIPGCTDMVGLASSVQQALFKEGLEVPVIEPPAAAVVIAEAMCDLGLCHSKRSWPRPPHKALTGYEDLEFA